MASARSAALALLATDLLARTSYGLCRTPLLPLVAASLGAGPAEIGAVGAAATAVGIVVKLPAGALSDAIGRAPLLLAGLVVFAGAPHLYPLAGSIAALGAVRIVHGFATALYSPVSMAAVAEAAGERKGEMLSWLSNTKTAGPLLGALLGGWILSGLGAPAAGTAGGAPPDPGTFSTAWIVAAFLGALALALGIAALAVSGAGTGPAKRGAWTKLVQGLRDAAKNRALILVSATEGLQNVSVGIIEQFLPVYVVLVAGRTPLEAGVMFGVQTVSTIACKPLFGRLSDRRGRRWLVIVGLVACAAPFAAIPFTADFPLLLLLSAVFGVGEALVTAAAGALAADVSEREGLGAAMGAFGTIGDVGHAAGPVLGGFLLAAFGWREGVTAREAAAAFQPCFAIVAAALLVVAVLFARSREVRGK